MSEKHLAACVCGAVQIELTGVPRLTGYCHCSDCRGWLGAPINAFSIWKMDQVRFLSGEADLEGFSKTPQTIRKRCKHCGAGVLSEHPEGGFIDVFAPAIRDFDHNPQVHVFYSERMIDMPDGLPKFRKFSGRDRTVGDMAE